MTDLDQARAITLKWRMEGLATFDRLNNAIATALQGRYEAGQRDQLERDAKTAEGYVDREEYIYVAHTIAAAIRAASAGGET